MNHRSHPRPAPWVPMPLGLVPAQRWQELDASHCLPSKMQTPQLGVQSMHDAAPGALSSSPTATLTPCPFHTKHSGAPQVCGAISPICHFPKHVHAYIIEHPTLMHLLEAEGVGWRKGSLLIVPSKAEC